jgi:hypothetical protein
MGTSKARALIATIVLTLLGVGVTIGIVDNGPDHGPDKPRRTITVTLGGQGHKKIPLTAAAQAQVAQQAKEDAAGQDEKAESDLHEQHQPSSTALEQARGRAPPGAPRIPQATTFASPSTAGCTSAFVRNVSSRPAGARVLLGVIHWTGSRPIANSTADDLAIVRWFDTPAAQASSNYITDDDGHCYYVVPESQKAWTQAGFNPWSVSDEHINAGVLPVFPTTAGRDAVVRLMRGWHERWKIPYQRGLVRGCTVIRPGFLAHRDLGSCGGGHPDIGIPSAVDELIRLAAAGEHPITSVDRATCRKLNAYRRDRDHGVKTSAHRGHINANRRKALERRGVTCTPTGPVRR